MSKTIFRSLNLLLKSQPPKFATGVPHVAGSGLPFRMFAGTSRVAKYQTLMVEPVHRVAYIYMMVYEVSVCLTCRSYIGVTYTAAVGVKSCAVGGWARGRDAAAVEAAASAAITAGKATACLTSSADCGSAAGRSVERDLVGG
jgi:hypothetical protein